MLRRSLRGVDDWRRWLSAERAWSWLVQVRPHAWQFVSLATVALLLLLRVDKDLSDLPYLVPAFFSGLSRRVYWILGTGALLTLVRFEVQVLHHHVDVRLLAFAFLAYAFTGLLVRALALEVVRARRMFQSALGAVAKALHYRDNYSLHHAEVAGPLARETARELGLPAQVAEDVYLGALLHDVGKIGVPDGTLLKPAALTAEEMAMVRRHPLIGYEIVGSIEGAERIALAIRHHHERWDGQGYPDGLAGETIPVEARIIAVTDAFEAMVDDRVYRQGRSPQEALAELRRCAGSQFDPRVVAAFERVLARQQRSLRRAPA